MCNLYNVTTNQEAVRAATRAMVDRIGNLEPSLDVYPDRMAPVVRNTPHGRELAIVRWGLPSSQKALLDAATKRADKLRAKGKPVEFDALLRMEPDGGTTNVRNTASKHWQRWLGVENRCVVPVTRFAEPDPASKVEGGRTPNAWFAHNADQTLMFFAGIWVPQWQSVRKVKLPGFNFHALNGFKPTRYTVHVNGPYCITFEFDGADVAKVDFENYH